MKSLIRLLLGGSSMHLIHPQLVGPWISGSIADKSSILVIEEGIEAGVVNKF